MRNVYNLLSYGVVGKSVCRMWVYSLQRSLTTHNKTDYYVHNSENNIYKLYDSSLGAPAETRVSCAGGTKVASAKIVINPYYPLCNGGLKDAYDVWTLFVHEAGHILGFDHSSLYRSVMNVYPVGTINRYLSSADVDGVNYLYK